MRIFVAGASGAIGRRLVPGLVAGGHQVVGSTTDRGKVEALRALGAEPVVVDGLDALAVGQAVARAEPEVVVHQMTALAGVTELKHFDRGFARTNELRTRGTDYLLAAAEAAGARRVVAQSYAGWPNVRSGGPAKTEEDALDPEPPREMRETFAAITYLERSVVAPSPIDGVVLRYGALYGPDTSMANEYTDLLRARKFPLVGNGAGIWSFLHVDDAATATVAAIEHGERGVYNVVDDDPAPVADWLPYLAACVGAKPPRHVPVWLARFAVGEVGVSMMTQVRGASNAKARRELGWAPRWTTWREGFRDGLREP